MQFVVELMVRLLVPEFQSCCPKPIWAIALKSLCVGIVFWGESSLYWGFQGSFFFYSLAHSLRSFAREHWWLISLLLSCRAVVGRAVSWRVGVGKLEPLLKLNTSTCTHLFSFLFPSSSLLFSIFLRFAQSFPPLLFLPVPPISGGFNKDKADVGLNLL